MFPTRAVPVPFLAALISSVVLSLLGLVQKTEDRAVDHDSARYVGIEGCQGCHEEAYQSFVKSAHEKTLNNKAAGDRGCEACHGPGVQHVNTGGDPAKIWTYSDASARTIVERCRRCHEASSGKEHAKGREHCLNCHSSHHYQQPQFLLRAAP